MSDPRSPSSDGEGSNNSRRADEFRFLDFAKEYLGLLGTVAAFPILTQALEVIPAPPGTRGLAAVSSFTCIIMLGATFLLRGPIRHLMVTSELRNISKKFLPFSVAILFTLIGLILTAFYVSDVAPYNQNGSVLNPEANGIPVIPWQTILIYLSIHPTLVLSLSIVLVTSFTQQKSYEIQSQVDDDLPDLADDIYQYLSQYAEFRRLHNEAGGEYLKTVGSKLLNPTKRYLKGLSKGTVVMEGMHIPQIQRALMDSMEHSFHSVSYRDIAFWSGEEDPNIVDEYLKSNVNAISQGKSVSRIFIFSKNDLEHYFRKIVEILYDQHIRNIEWAVAIYEDLPKTSASPRTALDFALFDWKEVVSFFRGHRSFRRRFIAVFDRTISGRQEITYQQIQYMELIVRCKLTSRRFTEMVFPTESVELAGSTSTSASQTTSKSHMSDDPKSVAFWKERHMEFSTLKQRLEIMNEMALRNIPNDVKKRLDKLPFLIIVENEATPQELCDKLKLLGGIDRLDITDNCKELTKDLTGGSETEAGKSEDDSSGK